MKVGKEWSQLVVPVSNERFESMVKPNGDLILTEEDMFYHSIIRVKIVDFPRDRQLKKESRANEIKFPIKKKVLKPKVTGKQLAIEMAKAYAKRLGKLNIQQLHQEAQLMGFEDLIK